MLEQVQPIPGQFFRVEPHTGVSGKKYVKVKIIARMPDGEEYLVLSRFVDQAPRSWSERGGYRMFGGLPVPEENITPALVNEAMDILKKLYIEGLSRVRLEDLYGDYPPKKIGV